MPTFRFILPLLFLFLFVQCKQETKAKSEITTTNTVKYAKGFSIENYANYSIITVKNPWPKASKSYQYILKKKNGIIPDSLKNNIVINIPIQSIVVTSTTHIPSLEMLNEEKSLVGFPNLAYVSSEKVRALIDAKNQRIRKQSILEHRSFN